jgi:hypothetical protein
MWDSDKPNWLSIRLSGSFGYSDKVKWPGIRLSGSNSDSDKTSGSVGNNKQ